MGTSNEDRRAEDPNVEERDDHPVGTTTGTGAGATAGAIAGMAVAGPPGAIVGAVVGGVVGGLAGHGIADAVNPEGDQVDGDVIPDPGTGHPRTELDPTDPTLRADDGDGIGTRRVD